MGQRPRGLLSPCRRSLEKRPATKKDTKRSDSPSPPFCDPATSLSMWVGAREGARRRTRASSQEVKGSGKVPQRLDRRQGHSREKRSLLGRFRKNGDFYRCVSGRDPFPPPKHALYIMIVFTERGGLAPTPQVCPRWGLPIKLTNLRLLQCTRKGCFSVLAYWVK